GTSFFFSSRRRHTRFSRDWSSDVCSSDLDDIEKSTITAFTLAFLVYNFKVFWAWIVDGVRIPVLGRLGQRVSWMLVAGTLVIAAVVNLALVDPAESIGATGVAAVLVGIAGATFDIVIDAYSI